MKFFSILMIGIFCFTFNATSSEAMTSYVSPDAHLQKMSPDNVGLHVEAPLKRIEISMTITASNGCVFHVTGWVDVSFGFSGVSIDAYDVNVSGPCGDFHFEGSQAPPADNTQEGELSTEQIKKIVTDIVNSNI